MSAVHDTWEADGSAAELGAGRLALTPEVVEVRRRGSLSAVLGLVASAVGVLYLQRAADTGAVLDWLLTAVMAVLAVYWLRSFVDARLPLLVADAQGVRLRLGRTWSGLRWSAVHHVEHDPQRAWWREGRLVVVPRNTEKVLSELEPAALRQTRIAERLWGAPLALPLGISTRVVGAEGDLTAALAGFAEHADVVVVEFDDADESSTTADSEIVAADNSIATDAADAAEVVETVESTDAAQASVVPASQGWRAKAQALLARRDSAPAEDLDAEEDLHRVEAPAIEPSATPQPTRVPHTARRSDEVVSGDDTAELVPLQGREIRVPGRVTLVEESAAARAISPIARAGEPIEPLVLDDHAAEPAEDPIIGPELAAARTRLGLTVDGLAERTRIRPHVIEAIEVDDFEPCGGDFYAKGHLRTLARVLGVAPDPLVETYEERYAHAPINPSRVFEADLASAGNGALRTSRSGPNWSALVAVVMAVVLAWSIARLAMDGPEELRDPSTLTNSSSQTNSTAAVPVTVSTASSGAQIVVRNGADKVVFRGTLPANSSKNIGKVAGPQIKVQSDAPDSWITINGKKKAPIGDVGQRSYSTRSAS